MTNDYFKTDSSGREYAGDHILLDLYGAVQLDNPEWIERVIEKACEVAKAQVILSNYHSFGQDQGVSGATILSESHITIHTWPERGFASIDVFMCGKANAMAAVQYLIAAFCANHFEIKTEKRGDAFAQTWGQHLILDLKGCDPEYLKSKANIMEWCASLVNAIDMKAYGAPLVEHFATHSHDAAGYTLIQLIETSNIAAHFAENVGEAYIDIFSCKPFVEKTAIDITKNYFFPQIIEKKSIRRG